MTDDARSGDGVSHDAADVYPWLVLACTTLGLAILLAGIYGGVL